MQARQDGAEPKLMHHADWLSSMLHGRGGLTDWNNSLKLGFDPGEEAYPEWLQSQVHAWTCACCCIGCDRSALCTVCQVILMPEQATGGCQNRQQVWPISCRGCERVAQHRPADSLAHECMRQCLGSVLTDCLTKLA